MRDEDDACREMESAAAIRGRYAAAANKNKSRILEEFVAATGYHEKSAIRVLNALPEPKRRQTRQRPSLYDEAGRGALIVFWEASDRICGKRLKACWRRHPPRGYMGDWTLLTRHQ